MKKYVWNLSSSLPANHFNIYLAQNLVCLFQARRRELWKCTFSLNLIKLEHRCEINQYQISLSCLLSVEQKMEFFWCSVHQLLENFSAKQSDWWTTACASEYSQVCASSGGMNYISGHGEYALFFRMEGVFNGLSLTGIGNSRVHQVIPTLLQQTGPTKLTVIESGPDTRTALIPSPVFFFPEGHW